MAFDATFRCQLISPETTVLDCRAFFAVVPAHDGQIGIAPSHAPLLCRLAPGALRVDSDRGVRRFYVDGGFARVRDDHLIVLTPRAFAAEVIDPAVVETMLAHAEAMPLSDPERAGQQIGRASCRERV